MDDDNLAPNPGDASLISGKIKPELKLSCTDSFTTRLDEESCDFDNSFTPRMLIEIASCIDIGIDSNEVHGFTRLGFPESALNLIEEMGMSSRNRNDVLGGLIGVFVLIINLNDCVCVLERSCANKDCVELDSK